MNQTISAPIRQRPGKISSYVVETAILIETKILDVAPMNGDCSSTWLILDASGVFYRLSASEPTCEVVGGNPVVGEPNGVNRFGSGCPLSLLTHKSYVSNNGRCAAVGNGCGPHAVVMSLETCGVTIPLSGDQNQTDQAPFSFALIEHQGRTLVICRTRWNRLDISDSETSAHLTRRVAPVLGTGKDKQEEDTSAFRGRLIVNPDGTFVSDNGWFWGTFRLREFFSRSGWLAGNVREFEDIHHGTGCPMDFIGTCRCAESTLLASLSQLLPATTMPLQAVSPPVALAS